MKRRVKVSRKGRTRQGRAGENLQPFSLGMRILSGLRSIKEGEEATNHPSPIPFFITGFPSLCSFSVLSIGGIEVWECWQESQLSQLEGTRVSSFLSWLTPKTDAVWKRLPRPEVCCSWHTTLFCNPEKGPNRKKQTGNQACRCVLSHCSDEQNVPGHHTDGPRVLGHCCGGQKMLELEGWGKLGK